MRKLVVRFLMLLFVLGMSTTAWAGSMLDDLRQSDPEKYEQIIAALNSQSYCARLTGHTSSTGGGKVYVNLSETSDPRIQCVANCESLNEEDRVYEPVEYVEGTSNVAVTGMGMSMAGMTQMPLAAWAKADDGYYLAGWSYANMGTDLGTSSGGQANMYYAMYDIGIQENETVDHVIYATFEPIRFAGYEITGNTTTSDDGNGNMVCNLAVIFTPSGAEVDIDASDFKTPVVSGAGWSLTSWDYNTTNAGKITVNVHFTTTSTDVAEYAGSLKLETQATPAISMNVPLNARTAASSEIEAIRYNKNKEKQGEGSLALMIAAADPTDVIKLNKNYNGQVVATKSFTLDLNGYNIEYQYNTPRASEFDEVAIAQAALLVNAGATVTIAYSPYGGEIIAGPFNDAADVFGKLVLNGGTLSGFFGIGSVGVVEQNGATINASPYSCCAIASQGKVTITDGKMNAMVGSMGDGSELIINGGIIDNTVIEDPQSYALFGVQIGGGVCRINKGTIIGRQYGVQNAGGEVTIEKLAVIRGGDSYYALDCQDGTTTVNCGKFEDPTKLWDPSTIESRMNEGKAEFVSGYFLTNNPGEDAYFGQHVWRNTSGAEFREEYEFFAGDLAAAQKEGVSVCHIGAVSYSKLEDALSYANNTNEQVVIVMDNDYTLPAGYYTLPANAKLLVPMSNEQGAETKTVNLHYSYETPSSFRKLILENGVNLDVFGTIEVSGSQYSGDDDHTGATSGAYGQLQLNKGSCIVLQNGSILRAWGYVTGDVEHKNARHEVPMGEIDARRGATVYELFQMGDWGNTIANGIGLVANDSHFPISSYYIQNIEAPVKYHPGSRLLTTTTVSASGGGLNLTMCANEIKIIGVSLQDVAMFLMNPNDDAENTWVRKWYDASKDQQVYEINSGAHIGNLVINLASSPLFNGMEDMLASMGGTLGLVGGVAQGMGAHFKKDLIMNSGQYVLPITSNFKLHALTGTLDFTQSTELIPGSELEIDKEATVLVTDQNNPNVLEGSLYIFDWQDWKTEAQKVSYSPSFDDGVWSGAVPDEVRNVSLEALGSAKVNVHGAFNTQDGYVFTSEHGGNIFSSIEDAGTFIFSKAAKAADYNEDVKITTGINLSTGIIGDTVQCYSAYLRNSDEYVAAMRAQHAVSEEEAEATYRYVKTGGTAKGKSYCYIDMGNGGEWTMLEQRGCVTYNVDGKCYIKPQEYVEIAVSDSTWNAEDAEWIVFKGNEDHTFSDAAGAGRLFINLGNPLAPVECQWWEVEQKDNYYHCIHPENDTYYEWWDDPDEEEPQYGEWKEKKFSITWKDWNGTLIDTYQVPYGTQAEWLSTNPTRPASIDYTYDFTGWSPALGKVTSDVTYTATYEAKQIKYTITFVQDGGMEIERHLLARNEMPVCENEPTRTGYILQWEPALAAVTHDTTYVATWLPEPPTEFAIRFVDYDGKTELQSGNVAVGTMPTPPAIVDGKPQKEDESFGGKPATAEYTYVFDHWSPAVTEVTQAMTYVAVYREEAVLYSVRFEDEDGNEIETNPYAYGETPVCSSAPTKTNTAQYTYSFAWTPQIQTVTGDATYRAVFTPTTNKYTVSVKSNPSGACAISGAGIYDYNTSATITLSVNSGYTFNGWSAGQGDLDTTITVTSDVNLVANFTYDGEGTKYTITWKNEAGTANLVDPVTQLENTATIYTGPAPTEVGDAQYSYVFDGWVTDTDYPEEGVFYKNNMTPKATGNATYYAHFAAVLNQYTVYWKNEAGTANIEMDIDQPYGAEVAYNSATPTKNADAEYSYTFDGWSASQGGEVEALPATVSGDAAFYAHFSKTPVLPTDLILGASGSTDLASADVKKNDLVITSNGINSSELKGADNLTLTGEAIFRLEKNFAAQTWYAVAVPWTVALSGIRDKSGNAFAANSVYVLEFDANAYATADRVGGRTDYWHFLDQNGHDMQPGKLYMIWFRNAQTAVEFHKKAGASIWTTSTSVALADGSNANQSNWNAIANPALYHADLSTGAADGDVLKYNGNDSYVLGSTSNMIVGEPMFVQVSSPATVVAVQIGGASPAPYHRAPETTTEADNRFVVVLTQAGQLNDRMIVQTAEEKADTYVIGKDLAKMGVSAQNAQMWINRYDAKLCKNTLALQGESVEYPLNISAPQAGEYILSATQERGNATLYLTRNGEAIWNLSESDYVMTLEQGTTAEYGLRVSVKAPQVATGMDEAVVDAQGETQKVLIDNKVFIIRGNNVYTVDGQMVK